MHSFHVCARGLLDTVQIILAPIADLVGFCVKGKVHGILNFNNEYFQQNSIIF